MVADQPLEDGGTDAGMSPLELFVGSLASCVGYFVARFCARRGLAADGFTVEAEWELAEGPHRVGAMRLTVRLPGALTPEDQVRLLKVARGCTVHQSLAVPPAVEIRPRRRPPVCLQPGREARRRLDGPDGFGDGGRVGKAADEAVVPRGSPAMIRVKRVYEPPARGDGTRILVDRLWPRGISRDALKLDAWLKDVAPSDALRRWFAHDPAKWDAFQRRYAAELAANPEAWRPILEAARRGTVTLLFGAKDAARNNAVALKAFLDRRRLRPRA